MPWWHLYVPKFFTVLKEGYGPADFRSDVVAGLTVAIVALPLSMALAIASGASPDKGLYTAIVAGFLISFLGGSRFQIGGPTGAFVVVVFSVIQKHGFDGLLIATFMAGIILVILGLLRIGTYIKYIPYPVVTGFTAGIAAIIFSSQIKDLLGLTLDGQPGNFVESWISYFHNISTISWQTVFVSMSTLAIILLLRRFRPGYPVFLIGIVYASVVVWATGMHVDTIGSRFGGIPSTLPVPAMPEGLTFKRIGDLFPSAFTIAFLAGIESLLSAVVADGMTGRRHRSNMELVAQGIANMASAVMGGLPATGAIARTATNIRTGARSPIAGCLHAGFLLVFMLLLAPLAVFVPLAGLGAILVIVAWNMSEVDRFRHLMSAPVGDRFVLLTTFLLTIFVDLTFAIEVGVVMAAILFMHRMAQVVEIESDIRLIEEDVDDLTSPQKRPDILDLEIPEGVAVYQINGPFFFGAATRLAETLERTGKGPKVFILRMRRVPMVDATGASTLSAFLDKCRRADVPVILAGLQPQVKAVLNRLHVTGWEGAHAIKADSFKEALEKAKTLMADRKEGA